MARVFLAWACSWAIRALALVAGIGTLLGGLWLGQAFETVIEGLPDAGMLTTRGLPIVSAFATAAG